MSRPLAFKRPRTFWLTLIILQGPLSKPRRVSRGTTFTAEGQKITQHNQGSPHRQDGGVPRRAQEPFPVAPLIPLGRGPEAEAAPQASLWHTIKRVERTM